MQGMEVAGRQRDVIQGRGVQRGVIAMPVIRAGILLVIKKSILNRQWNTMGRIGDGSSPKFQRLAVFLGITEAGSETKLLQRSAPMLIVGFPSVWISKALRLPDGFRHQIHPVCCGKMIEFHQKVAQGVSFRLPGVLKGRLPIGPEERLAGFLSEAEPIDSGSGGGRDVQGLAARRIGVARHGCLGFVIHQTSSIIGSQISILMNMRGSVLTLPKQSLARNLTE